MSRIISRAAIGSCLILAATFDLLAAEKIPKGNPADAKARQDVLAALSAEAAGNNERRGEQLAHAAAIAPELAEANWHLGRVRVGDRWLELAAAERRAANEPQIAEYRHLREEAGSNPKLIRGLARWCLKAGWEDTARLHYAQLLGRSDLDEETLKVAIKRMDLHQVGDKWMTVEEVKVQHERARAIDIALRQWRPRLKKLQVAIDGDDYTIRERAIKELQAIDDPQAIIPIASFQLDGGDRFCEEAAKALAKFPQYEATEALVHLAVLSEFSAARQSAIAGLKDRSKHDYVPLLLSGLVAPIRSQFSFAVGRSGVVQFSQAVVQETATARIVNVSSQAAVPLTWHPRRGVYTVGTPMSSRVDVVLSAASHAFQADQELELQARAVNMQADVTNRRAFEALEQLADAQAGRDANQWWQWWQDYNQYSWPKQTYYAYRQRPSSAYFAGVGCSCFVAGTPVRTQLGFVSVEAIKPGDAVLAQDQNTGELAYKAVLRTTVRPPSSMVKIDAAGEQIVTTLGHPFWVDGHGWRMAKELAAGDLLHSVGGAVRVEKVEPAGEDKAYNPVVDDFNTYFVGNAGLLVHDNEFRKPTRAIVPGLVAEGAGSGTR